MSENLPMLWNPDINGPEDDLTTSSAAGDYYEDKAKEARELCALLAQAIARKAAPAEIQRLSRRLEDAYYVGD